MNRKNRILFAAAVALVLCLGCAHLLVGQETPVVRAQPDLESAAEDTASPEVPIIDEMILHIKSSPDGSKVALATARDKGAEQGHIRIFDLDSKRVQKTIPLRLSYPGPSLTWSSDSRRLAAIGEEGILIVEKDGTTHTVAKGKPVSKVIWREDQPSRLIYLPSEDSTSVYEVDLVSGSEKELAIGNFLVGLFNAKGRPCVGYLEGTSWSKVVHKTVYVAEIDTKRRILQIPKPALEGPWDGYTVSVSPCGTYFFLATRASGGALNIIARCEDAQIINRKPWVTIFYGSSTFEPLNLTWQLKGKWSTGGKSASVAIVDSIFLDLHTGHRTQEFLRGCNVVDFLNSSAEGAGLYLLVDEKGLWQVKPYHTESLLLKHKPRTLPGTSAGVRAGTPGNQLRPPSCVIGM